MTWEISATSSEAAAVLFRWKQIISSMRLSRSSLPLNPCNQHHVHHPTPPSFLDLKLIELIEFIIRLVHVFHSTRECLNLRTKISQILVMNIHKLNFWKPLYHHFFVTKKSPFYNCLPSFVLLIEYIWLFIKLRFKIFTKKLLVNRHITCLDFAWNSFSTRLQGYKPCSTHLETF